MKDQEKILEEQRQNALANPFPKYNHIQLSVLERDHAEVYVDVVPESKNFGGTVHGGLYFTMADFCGATAARTDGRRYVTLNAEAHYIKTVSEGRVTAKADVVHRGRTSCLCEVKIRSEENVLLFTSMITMFCLGE